MNNREIAVRIEGVKKQYKLGQIGGGTLQADLQSWWAKVRGKEDPNRKIGDNRIIGETFMALNGIDLTIYEGERVGIIGRNGAGKSTLLKLLARVTAPTEGDIDIYGRITSMLEVGTGFNGELTGRENIYMNGAILGMTKAEIDSKIEDIIDFSEVSEFIDTPVKRYSSGMYVKLAFAVAAHLDSEIMIMDEVLAVGDMSFQKKCLDKMSEVSASEGRTILYVSHNMNTIRRLCDRCIVLDEGIVIFDGDVDGGISVYMNEKLDLDYPVFFDFTGIKRQFQFGKKLFINNFRLINKNIAKYSAREDFEFSLSINSTCCINKLYLFLIFRNSEQQIVGTTISNPFSIDTNQTKVINGNFDLSGFVIDDYFVNLEVIEINEKGNYYSYDNPGVQIKIKITENSNLLNWEKRFWGNIRCSDIKIFEG